MPDPLNPAMLNPPATANPSESSLADMPWRMSILAALPVALCLTILDLPDLTEHFSFAFRTLYFCAFLIWSMPVAALQRLLWRKHLAWSKASLALLIVTYSMSVANSIAGRLLAVQLGIAKAMSWNDIFNGLDSCWLALIAYCAVHAVMAYYFALARQQLRVAQAETLARDAQLRALRYQLNPHFLFNTLNAISALVATERNHDAKRMIAQLGDFLRATLDSDDRHEHALAEELALTDAYLEIEKARLGDKLKLLMHIGPDVLDARVPYLLIQPLVENAIRHGIAQRHTTGTLEIRIQRMNDRLHIHVENDCASDTSRVQGSQGTSTGIGLRNVSERLEKLYGKAHTLTAQDTQPGRYDVQISLPFQLDEVAVSRTMERAA